MYEQNEVPVFRRILWIVLWFIVIIAVAWVLIWLIFFRHSTKKTTANKPLTTQSQSKTKATKPTTSKSSATPATGSGTNSSSPSSAPSTTTAPASPATNPDSSTSTPAPTQLVNTGAGDMVVPFVVASVGGSTLYYVRLRRKVLN